MSSEAAKQTVASVLPLPSITPEVPFFTYLCICGMHFKCTTADATVRCVSSATNTEPPPQADLLDMLGSQSFLPIISILYDGHCVKQVLGTGA